MKLIAVAIALGLWGCSSGPQPVKVTGYQPITKTTYSQTPEGQLQQFVDQGFAHYWKGDYARAAQHLQMAFLLDSEHESWARYILYFCLMATGEYEQAGSLAETLVKARPHESMGYEQVGLAQLWQGKISAAIVNFQRALEFETHSPTVNFYIGVAYEKQKKSSLRNNYFQKAEAEYLQILKTNPMDFNSNYELASLYLYWEQKLAQVPDLVKAARESLLLNSPESLAPEKNVYFNYYLPRLEGIHLVKVGKAKEGLGVLFHSANNAPSGVKADLAEIYLYIGAAYRRLGEPANASNFLAKARELDPRGPLLGKIRDEFRTLSSIKKTWP